MKTILIPTDFSEESKTSAGYGIQLAKEKNAKLILLHVFHIPIYAGNDPVFMPPFDELENSNIDMLNEYENEIRVKYSFTNPIENITKSGFLINEIADIVEDKNVDLIVMGISDAGKFSELILGSHAIGVIKNTTCPTLIVPEGATYHTINTIVLACDDIEKIRGTSALKQITKYVQLFNSRLIVINVVDSFENIDFKQTLFEAKNKTIFEGINYSVHFIEGDNLIKNLNDFIDKNNADLLIMIPKKHTAFSKLFHISSTKKMAFRSHIPLLAIHE